MKNFTRIVLVSIMLVPMVAFSQQVFNFEELTIPEDGYWNGSDESGGFGNEYVNFGNNYNPDYGSWSNFAFAYDTIISDKQYAAYASSVSGHVFGIGFVPSDWESGTYNNIPIVCKFNNPVNILSLEVTNNASTADVILNGSAFGDPAFTTDDYFKIIIEGFFNNQSTGAVEYLLADYTSGNEIIVDTWDELDLSLFGTVDSIQFNLESTHTGDYGMNTPAYFCFDNLIFETISSLSENIKNDIKIYPNPTTDFININGVGEGQISLTDISGKVIYQKNNCSQNEIIDLTSFNSGIYIINVMSENYSISGKVIKK